MKSNQNEINDKHPAFDKSYEDLRNELYNLFKLKGFNKISPNFFGMIGEMVARNI